MLAKLGTLARRRINENNDSILLYARITAVNPFGGTNRGRNNGGECYNNRDFMQ